MKVILEVSKIESKMFNHIIVVVLRKTIKFNMREVLCLTPQRGGHFSHLKDDLQDQPQDQPQDHPQDHLQDHPQDDSQYEPAPPGEQHFVYGNHVVKARRRKGTSLARKRGTAEGEPTIGYLLSHFKVAYM